ncbi:MAG: exonuclease subunit SbcD, partial [Candidatus Sericytochromatia bacterium]
MRLLHTSDWHLGHALHGVSREYEHTQFMEWLLDTLTADEVDALLITGDVFETHNPGAAAQAAWYAFLADAKRRLPELQIVVIGGNHDSAERLNAPTPLLTHFGIHVVGGLLRLDDDALDLERLVIPLRDRSGAPAAWLAAVPYLRTADLRTTDEASQDSLQEGVRRIYAEVLAAARARLEAGQALIATGHCYMQGGALSELSERKILGGNQHALPVDIFPDDVAYAALGHLHKAQAVGKEHMRYAGSPLPLSMAEMHYKHQVMVVDLAGGVVEAMRAIEVPRMVPLLRVPSDGPRPLAEVIEKLKALPARDTVAREELRPYLEVCVQLNGLEPRLKYEIEAALDGRAARLLTIKTTTPAGEL